VQQWLYRVQQVVVEDIQLCIVHHLTIQQLIDDYVSIVVQHQERMQVNRSVHQDWQPFV
jgi:hypothetical protein